MSELRFDRQVGRLLRGETVFDPALREWRRAAGPVDGAQPITPIEAARWLQADREARMRMPVGVVGPRHASAEQLADAEELGGRLARLGVSVVCGGKVGVMEAVCKGVAAGGGTSIGLLPDDEARAANAYVTIPIATGLGLARNAVIARSAFCLVAVGGGYGTLSEIAYGLQFGKVVYGISQAPAVDGMVFLTSPAEVEEAIARLLICL